MDKLSLIGNYEILAILDYLDIISLMKVSSMARKFRLLANCVHTPSLSIQAYITPEDIHSSFSKLQSIPNFILMHSTGDVSIDSGISAASKRWPKQLNGIYAKCPSIQYNHRFTYDGENSLVSMTCGFPEATISTFLISETIYNILDKSRFDFIRIIIIYNYFVNMILYDFIFNQRQRFRLFTNQLY